MTPGRTFVGEFHFRKKRQKTAAILLFPFLVGLVVFGGASDPKTAEAFGISALIWVPIVLLALVAVAVFSWKNWRCPSCDKYLGKQMSPRFCSHCGVDFF